MWSVRQAVYFSLGVALILLGLGQAANTAQQPDVDGVLIVAKEGSGTATLEQGKELVIKLGTQAGTGYVWRVTKNDEKILEPIGKQPTVEKAGDPGVIGGPQLSVFRFRAAAPGIGIVDFEYVRPFEKEGKAARRFQAVAKVLGPSK